MEKILIEMKVFRHICRMNYFFLELKEVRKYDLYSNKRNNVRSPAAWK
jgi:hypothetical protein